MSATEEVTQLQLIPDEPLELAQDTMLTSVLAHEEVQTPTKQLIDSIKRFGLLQPLLVRYNEEANPPYNIVDGRRRLAVARMLALNTIPVVIAETNLAIADVATLAANATRTNNPVAEFHAIKRLTEAGASEREIAGATGMSRQTIKSRQSLLRLTPALMHAFAEGKMTATVADGAAKLPAVLQKELATTLLTEKKITERDLHEIKTAQTQKAMAGIAGAFDFGEEFEAAQGDEAPDASVEYALAQELQGIIDRMPQQQTTLIRSLQWVATMLLDLAMGVTPDYSTQVPPESDAELARGLAESTAEQGGYALAVGEATMIPSKNVWSDEWSDEDEEPKPESADNFDDQSDMPMPWELSGDER